MRIKIKRKKGTKMTKKEKELKVEVDNFFQVIGYLNDEEAYDFAQEVFPNKPEMMKNDDCRNWACKRGYRILIKREKEMDEILRKERILNFLKKEGLEYLTQYIKQ